MDNWMRYTFPKTFERSSLKVHLKESKIYSFSVLCCSLLELRRIKAGEEEAEEEDSCAALMRQSRTHLLS